MSHPRRESQGRVTETNLQLRNFIRTRELYLGGWRARGDAQGQGHGRGGKEELLGAHGGGIMLRRGVLFLYFFFT